MLTKIHPIGKPKDFFWKRVKFLIPMRSLIRQIFPVVCYCAGLFSLVPTVQAAEQISIRAGGFERTLAVAELRRLVNTGELSGGDYFKLSILILIWCGVSCSLDLKSFDLNVTLIDKLLNSYLMDLLLQDLAKSLRSPGGESSSVAALKSAIIASVADDNQISAIEFIFPPQEDSRFTDEMNCGRNQTDLGLRSM